MNDEAAQQPNVATRAEQPVEAPEKEAYARIGQVVGGKYKLEEILGSGGMAHVYRAMHEAIGRGVAIKVLRKHFTFEQSIVGRFLREARTANSVRHPNVVSVMDVGTTDDGCPYLVQELLEGETLFDHLSRVGQLELSDVVELVSPILGAVAEAHASGVIHRDIKPENVFLAGTRGKRVPKLLDFGISKAANSPSMESTAAGIIMGTPAYMAPELARAAKDADARSDVWACGIMLFEVLTGKVPFEGDSVPQMFLAIATRDAARLVDVRPDVPASVSAIVARCLKRNPAERYPTATELAADLNSALDPRELALVTKRESGAVPARSSSALKARPRTIKMESSPLPVPRPVSTLASAKADSARAASAPISDAPSSVSVTPSIEGLRGEGGDSTEPAMQKPRSLVARPPPEDLPRSRAPVVSPPELEDTVPAMPSDVASILRAPTREQREEIESARKIAAAALAESGTKARTPVQEEAATSSKSPPRSEPKPDSTLPSPSPQATYVTIGALLLALAFVIVALAMMR